MTKLPPIPDAAFKARAVPVAERIDLKAWGAADALSINPLTVPVKGGGAAAPHRYGVVVFFGVRAAHEAGERSLDLISRTAHTVLELVSSKHSLRVEWYILVLILFEILLTLHRLFFR